MSQKKWTKEEDEILLSEFNHGTTLKLIGKKLKRSEESVRARKDRLMGILSEFKEVEKDSENINKIDNSDLISLALKTIESFDPIDSIEIRLGEYSITIKKLD